MMMNTYRDILPRIGGYLTDKTAMHLPRVELFLQEVARREALYFEQRAVDDKEKEFGGEGYRSHYYEVPAWYALTFVLHVILRTSC